MTLQTLKFVSEAKLEELRQQVAANRERYLSSGFDDLESDNGWSIDAKSCRVDLAALAHLNGRDQGAAGDARNSLVLYRALQGMTPALATEERVWVRLTHIECITYCRDRWLATVASEKLDEQIHKHLFAGGRTGIRDDNALSRLWWNAHIAAIANPEDPSEALQYILMKADIRSNIVERARAGSRAQLLRAIIRQMKNQAWMTEKEENFRFFMKRLNRDGGGIIFESFTDSEADLFLENVLTVAKHDAAP